MKLAGLDGFNHDFERLFAVQRELGRATQAADEIRRTNERLEEIGPRFVPYENELLRAARVVQEHVERTTRPPFTESFHSLLRDQEALFATLKPTLELYGQEIARPVRALQEEFEGVLHSPLVEDFRKYWERQQELGRIAGVDLDRGLLDLIGGLTVSRRACDELLMPDLNAVLTVGTDFDVLGWRESSTDIHQAALWRDPQWDDLLPAQTFVTVECQVVCAICENPMHVPTEQRRWNSGSHMIIELGVFPICAECAATANGDPNYWLEQLQRLQREFLRTRFRLVRGGGEGVAGEDSKPNIRLVEDLGDDNSADD